VVKVEVVEGSEEAQDVAFQNRKLSQKLHAMAQFGTFVLLVFKTRKDAKAKCTERSCQTDTVCHTAHKKRQYS